MNNITEVVFILDASGSMHELTDDTIGGFNSMIAEQKELEGTVFVSTVSFNDRSRVIHDRINISDVPMMTRKDYVATGSTALVDAVGDAIHHISLIHKYIRKEDLPDKTMFVITTDGLENSSHRYSSDELKQMIEAKKSVGWEFVFLGANMDAVETAKSYGIREERAILYNNDSAGTGARYRSMSKLMTGIRTCEAIPDDWMEEIEADKKSRK